MSQINAAPNVDQPVLPASGETSADAPIVLPSHILAFEMQDDSMHPRIHLGEFALLRECADIDGEVGEEVLVQLADGKWHLRTIQRCSSRTVTLSAYNLPSHVKVRRRDITAIYRVDMIVPPPTFAYMTNQVVHWAVRDASGNEYGTFPTHDEALAFGGAVAEQLDLDEMRYCRIVVPAAHRVQAEVTQ
jgi:hypothetical protein